MAAVHIFKNKRKEGGEDEEYGGERKLEEARRVIVRSETVKGTEG